MTTVSLKQLRTMCGKTQIEVAKYMHVTQQTISKIEHSQSNTKEIIKLYVESLGGKFDGVATFSTWSVMVDGVDNEYV